MTLHAIVAALGGDLYSGGFRANVPAPGHSRADRSVSLMLSGGRLLIHSFGEADWRSVRDQLRTAGFIDDEGRLAALSRQTSSPSAQRPTDAARVAVARRLWDNASPVHPSTLSSRHLAIRAIRQDPSTFGSLRHHPDAPLAVYRRSSPTRPALVAAITAPDGTLSAVELTYLAPSGRRDTSVRTPRKTVGLVPQGAAVRLAAGAPVLLVGEGVMTVLSAADLFGLPAWALLSAGNLALWTPPPTVSEVVIAADRGRVGEAAARRLLTRLTAAGVMATVSLPPAGDEDWNAAAVRKAKEGRGGAPDRRG